MSRMTIFIGLSLLLIAQSQTVANETVPQDEVVLLDGTTYRGKITQVSEMYVRIVIESDGESIPLDLDRRTVRKMTRAEEVAAQQAALMRLQKRDKEREEGEHDATVPGLSDTINNAQGNRSGTPQYWEIPIRGAIGDVPGATHYASASAIEMILQSAAEQGIEHIVFRVDSTGGYVEVASQMAGAMREYDDRLTYHAIVSDGLSAAIWIIFGCDNIFVTDGARIGAAVTFSPGRLVDESVEAKFRSAHAAEVVAIAERKNHAALTCPHFMYHPL